jgi:hypothetical protein
MPSEQENVGISPDAMLRRILSDAIKRSGKKRQQIAEEMTAELPGSRVTMPMLNDFTSLRKSAARFPAAFVKAFCNVVGSNALQRWLLDDASLRLIEVGEHVRDCREIVGRIEALFEEISNAQAPKRTAKTRSSKLETASSGDCK